MCAIDDEVLRPMLEQYPGCRVVVMAPDEANPASLARHTGASRGSHIGSERALYPRIDRMQRPILSASGLTALEYHHRSFERNLGELTAGSTGRHFPLSISSFCPDWPKGPSTYAEPAEAFHRLDDMLWFLCSFFASQLVDQASHSSLGFVPKQRANSQGQIVLVGLHGSYWNVMTPAYLLLVISLYRRPVSDHEVADGVSAVLQSELKDLELEPKTRAAVLDNALAALQSQAIPDSLRAFVPRGDQYWLQPDRVFVELVRQSAEGAVVAAAV